MKEDDVTMIDDDISDEKYFYGNLDEMNHVDGSDYNPLNNNNYERFRQENQYYKEKTGVGKIIIIVLIVVILVAILFRVGWYFLYEYLQAEFTKIHSGEMY